jgi:1-acyl-sn-glycerol-3-phosphate acyltransferase
VERNADLVGSDGDRSRAERPAGVRREHGPLFLAIYNVFYWPYLLSTGALYFGPALVVFLVTFLWDPRRRFLHAYTCLWGGHYLAWAPFAGVAVEGRKKLQGIGPCIYVSNHQSMVDILAIFATRFSFLWVSKIENFYVPFLGWNMWLNRYIGLKRGYLPSIMRMVRTCNRRLSSGYSLFIFPEGTRSPDGNLSSFYSGAFRLAVRNGVPIVPLVIEGTNDILPKHSFSIRPRPVTVRVLDPIHPVAVDNDHRALLDQVRGAMLDEQRRLRGSNASV